MAYSDYGAFVYRNGERRRDKEDVGVYDTDEANLPSGMRVYANIIKNMDRDAQWWEHSHHGVMGDGPVRVGCYKQGFPEFYVWPDGADGPTAVSQASVVDANGWGGEEFVSEFRGNAYIDYDYELYDFHVPGCDGYLFSATGHTLTEAPAYWARMVEPDGTVWECDYDYGYGAGLTDCEED